jgi:hypothetical protein
MRNTWIDTTPKKSINTMSDFEDFCNTIGIKGITEKEFTEYLKKVFDKNFSPEYLGSIFKLMANISKQNPNLN